MAMSPEERRQRMRKALSQNESRTRSSRARRRPELNEKDLENFIDSFDEEEPKVNKVEIKKVLESSSAEQAEEIRPRRRSAQNGTRRSVSTGGQRRNTGSGGKRPARRSTPAKEKASIDQDMIKKIIMIAAAVIVALVLIVFGVKVVKGMFGSGPKGTPSESVAEVESAAAEETEPEEVLPEIDYMGEASLMAAQYDYDGAIDLLKSMPDYAENEEAKALVEQCEETKTTLVKQDIHEITHVFFHILCVDPVNSFDESKWGKQAGGYNSLMTTIDEFKKMMQEMYEKGYVLVWLHDIAAPETQPDGSVKMVEGNIMLPPGKKAFVMSEDDVCYYEYMQGAGYADKMIIGEDGKPTLHYTDKDGNEFVGDYDLLGVLDTFIDEHPDFSYKGHKACLVFTGYNGILGYRTDESYDPNSEYYDEKLEQGHDVAAERKEVVEVLKAVVADGYEVGSHSWGHRDLGQIEFDRFKKDCDRWNRNVATLIKEATGEQPDIIIYPKGADVADWHGYDHNNARFDYMYQLGFRYFCNVDSSQYWVQLGADHLRQGRRALDGYNMWNDIAKGYNRLGDLFDNVSEIFDPARPTPVPAY